MNGSHASTVLFVHTRACTHACNQGKHLRKLAGYRLRHQSHEYHLSEAESVFCAWIRCISGMRCQKVMVLLTPTTPHSPIPWL